MSSIAWVLESDVFPESHPPLRDAVRSAGHRLIDWDDAWWQDGIPCAIGDGPIVFHGSLGNAAAIQSRLAWKPGSFCNDTAFYCSQWYEDARDLLLHSDWRVLPLDEFVAKARAVCDDLGCLDRVFVRPDSPLKPFSGRVLDTESITLASLDHGFYFDDETIPIVAAPVRNVGREWRFVVVGSDVVAGSSYDPSTRSATPDVPEGRAWMFADSVVSRVTSPAEVYIVDVCESDGGIRLLELNPFGGADLYACNASKVVDTVSEVALHEFMR